MRLSSVNPRRVLDWVAVLFPLAVSMAANYAWAARDGDQIAIVAGLVVPILLVLSVERWHAHRGLEGWQWWVRLAAMTLVTGVAAAVSWVHTSLLLYHHGWEPPLAIAGPLGVDGLAVLGTLALWPVVQAGLPVQTEPAVDQTGPDRTTNDEDTGPLPVVQRTTELHAVDQPADWTDELIVADLVQRGEAGSVNQRTIRTRYRVGPTKANRVLAVVQPEREAVGQ